ncbi:chitin deacetylase 8-like [Leptidea sinapis]|uniref:chitin deacetylase 8-like n=1 Tax=Leptidea sinapis TaxID=189913 RepID=UPI002122D92E|nr:chitin deacetylase 8-like [Leptidea sinapis]
MRAAWYFVLLCFAFAEDELKLAEPCDPEVCKLPDCRCSSTLIPGDLHPARTPQFVLLTFDDAVAVTNMPNYKRLLFGRKNSNQCPIGTTFFVSHEYTNYQLVNELYNEGFEIALHSISHMNQTYFENADYETLMREFSDQAELMAHFAALPIHDMQGVRMPFLQMAGNASFQMMKSAGLYYDISMPTISFTNPGMWPYTLDYASTQDCVIPPCPTASIPGVWVVPMISWTDLQGFPCGMADSCFSPPDGNDEHGWFRFIVENFERHYLGNRAPFPFYLHESYFRDRPGFEAAFIRFLDMINSMNDVFMVNAAEAIDWIRNPVPIGEYVNQPCRFFMQQRCRPSVCGPLTAPHKTELFWMAACNTCPRTYPWLGNPLGV